MNEPARATLVSYRIDEQRMPKRASMLCKRKYSPERGCRKRLRSNFRTLFPLESPARAFKDGFCAYAIGNKTPYAEHYPKLSLWLPGEGGNFMDFFCSGIQFYVLLSPYLCFISFLYLDLYVLGGDAWIS